MDNKKILLVNLSKGKMGELNSKLLGIIFVMKFQAAAMSRANIDEDQRVDFSLYVDEFQNFATDSFESIMSEARKYRLSLIMGNQFMTQLTDKIREAIIGNVGTVVSGRIGVTDAELMVKKFQPVFDIDDLTKLPNFQSIASVMINDVPSAPFSMNWVAPMGTMNKQLRDALIRLSAAKYGKPRAQVEKEIFTRLGQSNKPSAAPRTVSAGGGAKPGGSSFLDDWLAKRKQLGGSQTTGPMASASPVSNAAPLSSSPTQPVLVAPASVTGSPMGPAAAPPLPVTPPPAAVSAPVAVPTATRSAGNMQDQIAAELEKPAEPVASKTHLDLRAGDDDEVTVSFR